MSLNPSPSFADDGSDIKFEVWRWDIVSNPVKEATDTICSTQTAPFDLRIKTAA